jgi:fluoride exporter
VFLRVFLKLALIAAAGAVGTLARYGLGGLVHKYAGDTFPWGTVVVNLLGCLAFGVVWTFAEERWHISSETRTVLLVGFMGAFTTFSTFIFETKGFLSDGQWLPALGYFSIHNVGGLAALLVGLALGRLL